MTFESLCMTIGLSSISLVIYHSRGKLTIFVSLTIPAILILPKQVFFGREAYPTVCLKAAYYLQKITEKRLFADSNKRIAFEAAKIFLLLNVVILHVKSVQEVMLKVAKYLKNHQVKQ